jgi:hypothetical protein
MVMFFDLVKSRNNSIWFILEHSTLYVKVGTSSASL